jgi:hypothetical protein
MKTTAEESNNSPIVIPDSPSQECKRKRSDDDTDENDVELKKYKDISKAQ